jgi:hypothetical protein
MNSLDQIRKTLLAMLNNQILFSLLTTRLILRTGVDLTAIKPTEDRNPAAVQKVLEALKAMGYTLTPGDPSPPQPG